jgi:hypothetical protein
VRRTLDLKLFLPGLHQRPAFIEALRRSRKVNATINPKSAKYRAFNLTKTFIVIGIF